MIRIVIDTNIHISGFGFGGKIAQLIGYCYASDEIEVYLSNNLILEIKQKFLGGRLEKIKKDGFSIEKVNEYLETLEIRSIFMETTTHFKICRDPNDNMILDLAFASKADFIITGDEDLLTLNPFKATRIVKPSEFMKIIDAK